MIMICVDNGTIENLTLGKQYEVIRDNSGVYPGSNLKFEGYWILNDVGIEKFYNWERFIPVSEWREMKLHTLLNK